MRGGESIRRLAEKGWNSPTITTWFSFSTKILRLVVVLPLVLKLLTPGEISVYYLFFAVAAVGSALTTSFSTTYVRSFSYAWGGAKGLEKSDFHEKSSGKPNVELFQSVYATTSVVQRWVFVVVIGCLATLGSMALRPHIQGLDNNGVGWAAWILQIGAIGFGICAARQGSLIQGVGQIARANRVGVIFGVFTVTIICIALLTGTGLLGLSVANLIGAAISYLRLRHVAGQVCPPEFFITNGARFNKEVFASIWEPTWRQLAIVLSTTGIVQASGFVLGFTTTGAALASYLVALRMMNQASEISRAPFYSQIPRFCRLRGSGDVDELARATGRATGNSLLTFGFLVMGFGIGIPLMLRIIDTEVEFIAPGLWSLMAFIWFIERHHGMQAQVVLTQNRVPFVAATIFTGAVNLLLMCLLVPRFGVLGILVAHGVANSLVFSWWTTVLSMRSLEGKWRTNFASMWRRAALGFSLMLLGAAASWYLSSEAGLLLIEKVL